MASILGDRVGRMAISPQIMQGILNSIATRLDEARDIARYMTGLLVFLGLLGTFWGLIETVGSVGGVIQKLNVGGGESARSSISSRRGLRPRLSGMGISFSSSLFGLAGSLVLGFLDLQMSQAQNRFYTQLEDWLSTTVRDLSLEPDARGAGAGARLAAARSSCVDRAAQGGDQRGRIARATTTAMANLAEAIQGLVNHMRTEQQMIRDWVESQSQQQRDISRLLELLVREDVNK